MHLFCSFMIKNKNHNLILLYQNYGSYLAEKERFSRRSRPLVEIVVSGVYAVAPTRYSFSPPISRSLYPPPAAVALDALAGEPARFKSLSAKRKSTAIAVLFVLAEKERFELSRRLIPTYTLSRGASSANLSTSPCIKWTFLPCGSPFFKSALLLYPICLGLSISFLTFVDLFFIFFLSIEFISALCYNELNIFPEEVHYEQQSAR